MLFIFIYLIQYKPNRLMNYIIYKIIIKKYY